MSLIPAKLYFKPWVLLLTTSLSWTARAQETPPDSLLETATLENVVQYALEHQPTVQQALIDQEITNQIIKGKLADWYPQINFGLYYNRYFDLQSSVIGGNVIRFGVDNTSAAQFTATQNVFNRDVLLASSTASKVRILSEENITDSKIDVVVNVTKAFYDILATQQQVKVTEESLVRIEQSARDAYERYQSGVSDKTDYKRATILLGNAKATLKTNVELLKVKQEYLKALMGYPREYDITILYDTLQMEQEIALDTLQAFNVVNHIDYKMLFLQGELQDANVRHSQWAFLPTLTLSGIYNLNYQSNNFDELFKTQYPYSYLNATLSLPIFQGGKRTAMIREQKWTRSRIDMALINLENTLSAEYTRALASYKSNLAQYFTQKENVTLAQEVYEIIELQYRSGIRAYLDVTIAETDLQTTRINYFNALYQVLASKIDVQRALGQININ